MFSNLNSNCSNLTYLQEVKKTFCYQKLFWSFTVRTNCSSDLENFANSHPSASNFKGFPRSREQFFFLTIGEDNFGNKIPILNVYRHSWTHYTVKGSNFKSQHKSWFTRVEYGRCCRWNNYHLSWNYRLFQKLHPRQVS